MLKRYKLLLVASLFATSIFFVQAQKAPQKNWSSSRILHELHKIKQVGRVLYVAAHPDDENTRLIAYMVNDKGLETGYISLTRGDGGQNLIGAEVREKLGLIRTQELLMARETDGGQQFFSRANDFGYSKTAEETFRIWNREEVLADLVFTIRRFKPDVIITRFSPTYTKTHGHHQASAILAQEAFVAAADPKRYPEQLAYVQPWQAQSLYWNTSLFFFQNEKFDTAGLYHLNVGSYLPLLGKSVGELAADSRSMHKSQGFGSSPGRGDVMEYFVHLLGKRPADKNILSVANMQWSRIKGCETIPAAIDKLEEDFDVQHPEKSLPALISLHEKLAPFKNNYLVAAKIMQLEDIMLQCAGVYAEAISKNEYLPIGDSANVTLGVVVQNNAPLQIAEAALEIDGKKISNLTGRVSLKTNAYKTFTINTITPANTVFTGPYWLESPAVVGMYTVENQQLRGLPQNPQQVSVHVSYVLGNEKQKVSIDKYLPVFYKLTDPVKGELDYLAHVVPPVTVNPVEPLMIFRGIEPKELKVKLKSFTKSGKATVRLQLTDSKGALYLSHPNRAVFSSISPANIEVDLKPGGEEQTLTFIVTPGTNVGVEYAEIVVEMQQQQYNRALETINYEHIPKQVLLPQSKVKLLKLDIVIKSKLIGYIDGAGDDIPKMLRQLGYTVELIAANQLGTADFKKYDAIIAGVRAYNTVERLKYDNGRLMDYVKNGGNYIVQYNNNFRLVNENIGPYSFKLSNDRVTEEDAKVTLLNMAHPALNTPNKLTDEDFKGWVQERGLYYPNTWDSNYTPLLEMNDAGETPSRGSLLVADYGKGHFVYTALSFFRELPAGVPGAYRLFVNLIELGKTAK